MKLIPIIFFQSLKMRLKPSILPLAEKPLLDKKHRILLIISPNNLILPYSLHKFSTNLINLSNIDNKLMIFDKYLTRNLFTIANLYPCL